MKITALRQAASRQNGSRSRGPVTPAGKARSAQNARRHGMRARTGSARIMPVDPEFHSLRRATLHRWRPRTSTARLLAEALAVARWDLLQLDRRLDAGTNEPGLLLATRRRYRSTALRRLHAAAARLAAIKGPSAGTNEPGDTPGIEEPSPRERLAWLLGMADDAPELAMALELLAPSPGDPPAGPERFCMNEPDRPPPPLNRHQRRALAARRRC